MCFGHPEHTHKPATERKPLPAPKRTKETKKTK